MEESKAETTIDTTGKEERKLSESLTGKLHPPFLRFPNCISFELASRAKGDVRITLHFKLKIANSGQSQSLQPYHS